MDEKENKMEETLESKEELRGHKKAKIEKLENELYKARSDIEHWKNEYYRAYADTQNLRKSLEKDHSEAMKYRSEGFIEDLLPVLDSFHMALAKEPEDPTLKNYLIGFQYIYRNLVTVLENEGVKEIAPNVGDKFNPDTMNAVEITPTDGEENIITIVMTKGYKLHDRLVRPANVAVSGKPKQENNSEEKIDA